MDKSSELEEKIEKVVENVAIIRENLEQLKSKKEEMLKNVKEDIIKIVEKIISEQLLEKVQLHFEKSTQKCESQLDKIDNNLNEALIAHEDLNNNQQNMMETFQKCYGQTLDLLKDEETPKRMTEVQKCVHETCANFTTSRQNVMDTMADLTDKLYTLANSSIDSLEKLVRAKNEVTENFTAKKLLEFEKYINSSKQILENTAQLKQQFLHILNPKG